MQATMEDFALLIYQHCLSFLSTLLRLVCALSCCWASICICLHSEIPLLNSSLVYSSALLSSD